MTVITALETALYSKLTGTSALITALGGTAIYNKQAPQSPGSKFVVFNQQAGGDVNESPTRLRDVVYQVQAVGQTQGTAAAIDDIIDGALHKQTLTVTGWTNIWMAREGDINYNERDSAGVNWYHVGGLYRIMIDS